VAQVASSASAGVLYPSAECRRWDPTPQPAQLFTLLAHQGYLGGHAPRPACRAASLCEEFERIEAAFDQLSEEHREVISLAHLAGLLRAEIAERIQRSEGAVRVLLHRAPRACPGASRPAPIPLGRI
jgi:DNA-directed RNA polymerase specialized sigma24 family protein